MIRFNNYQFQPKLVPTLITLVLFTLLVGLGVWQVERAKWKRGIIENYNAQSHLPSLIALPPANDSDTLVYRHVTLGGKFENHRSIELRPRVVNGKMGYDLVTPLTLSTGEVVLVLRGFVPDETNDAVDQPIGTVAVSGMMRTFSAKYWRPDNEPEKNQWYWIDPEAISKKFALAKPYPLLLISDDKPVNSKWPQPQDAMPDFHPWHTLYAIQWFALAFALLVIYVTSQSVRRSE